MLVNCEGSSYGIYYYDGSSFNKIGTVAKAVAAGDRIDVVASGNTVTVTIGGVSTTVTNALYSLSTYDVVGSSIGIGCRSAAGHPKDLAFDDFYAAPL